jgi:hypothetical protein
VWKGDHGSLSMRAGMVLRMGPDLGAAEVVVIPHPFDAGFPGHASTRVNQG